MIQKLRILKAVSISVVSAFMVFAGKASAASDIASLPVNLGVAGITNMLYVVAFIGGILMILTPCSAATIPAYFANTFGEKSSGSKSKITQRTAVFFLGFSVVYAFMGGGASIIGRWLNLYQEQLATLAGILLIVFGVFVLLGLSFFSFSTSANSGKDTSVKGTFTFGSLFAIGFSGCAGPILAGILTIAASLPTTQAVLLMFFYSLGMGVPLLLLSLVFDKYNILNTRFFKWHKEVRIFGRNVFLNLPNLISGILLLALGAVFIAFRSTSALSASFPRAITDIGYGLQDWLLAMNLPTYIDVLIFVIAGFLVIKFVAKIFDEKKGNEVRINIDTNKIRFTLISILVLLFAFNQMVFFTKQSDLKRRAAIIAEANRPAELEIIVVEDPNCSDCFSVENSIEVLKSQNVKILSEKRLDMNSDEGRNVIDELGIKRIPNIVVKGEITKDDTVKSLLSQAGEVSGEVFYMSFVPPPYVDVESGEVKGRFRVTFLTDDSCSECYDIEGHRTALSNLGMNITDETTIDVSTPEGKNLISKYDIESVPTVLLFGDLGEYGSLEQVWPQVGSLEEDGTYVFRQVDIMGTYKNLETGEMIDPSQVDSQEQDSSQDDGASSQ